MDKSASNTLSRETSVAKLGGMLVDPDFENLCARLQTFNIFRALKLENHEIRHSNVLAWMMDPKGSHGLDAVFLKRVLTAILLEANHSKLSAAHIDLMDFTHVEVRREWRNIDLLIIDYTNKVAVVIENKVWSSESEGQLQKYRKTVEKEFPAVEFRHLFVLLTREGQEPEGDVAYECISYLKISEVIQQIFEQRKSQMTESVKIFIGHYIEILRSLTMQDDELSKLCKSIYSKHRDAIELIVDLGQRNVFQNSVEAELKVNNFEILHSGPSLVRFLPAVLKSVIPENGTAWKNFTRNVGVCCWCLNDWGKKIRLVFECSSMTDPEIRKVFIKAVRNSGFKPSKSADREDATYTRFYSCSEEVKDSSDDEAVRAALQRCLEKSEREFQKLEEACRCAFGGVLKK